jgi:hypothetical protein
MSGFQTREIAEMYRYPDCTADTPKNLKAQQECQDQESIDMFISATQAIRSS